MADEGKQPNDNNDGEEGQADAQAVFPSLKVGRDWGESITREDASELEEYWQTWSREADHHGFKGPFDWMRTGDELTGADVFYLAAGVMSTDVRDGTSRLIGYSEESLLSGEPYPVGLAPPNPKAADIVNEQLDGVRLSHVHLEGAELR
jgi:hypothetical protein